MCNIFFPLFTKPLHLYCLCYSTASLHANKEDQISTVNWLDFHPVSAQWYPGSSRGNSPPTSHINAGALQYFMHSAQCSWSSPFFGYPAVFVMLKWRVMFDQIGPKVQGHDRVCSSAGPTADVCRCFFTVVMLYFSDIISIIEDREHLTSLISLSETPHEIKGLAKVNKDTCHIQISLCHHHHSCISF